MSHQQIPIEKLVFSDDLYPRTGVDEMHIRQFERAMEAGISLPPIVVAKGSFIIVDGVHRFQAHLRRSVAKIAAVVKAYSNDADLWHDAVLFNTSHGLKLGQDDSLKVIEISERFGLKEIDVAGLLRTSIAHLRALKPRYATIEDAAADVSRLRRVGLKGSVRHLSGDSITADQASAIGRAPGTSYLLLTNQLLDAFKFDLLPPREKHPSLWDALVRLQETIAAKS